MAAEDSERLARRLQAEEDNLTELILHEATDEALARRLHEQYQLEATSTSDPDAPAPISLLNDPTIRNLALNSTTNSQEDLDSDEALARLLQAEEEQNAKAMTHGEGSAERRSPPSPSPQLKSDEEFARLLQEQEGQKAESRSHSEQISNDLELFSPTPDVHALFQLFDEQYFFGMLKVVEVNRWFVDFCVSKETC